jgi:catechol 2,3-dioxygenase-like lactoylglutathione lyase family enzyme
MATVRYLVKDVEAAVKFYTAFLGFKVEAQYGPAMAILSRSDLTLWLAGPQASAARAMPDGQIPSPGGWNRFVLQVDDLVQFTADLKSKGVKFRNEILKGPGGSQILCEDPSGNVIELFQTP